MDGSINPLRYPWPDPPENGEIQEVAPGILWLRLPLPMVLDHVNVYILDDGDGWTIVDTGIGSKRTKAIWNTVLEGPLRGKPLRRVVLTHHHLDHIGLAGWFQSEIGTTTLATRVGWLTARMLQLEVQERPTPQAQAFWRSGGMDAEILAKRMASRPFNSADGVDYLPVGYERLEDGGEITMGGRRWVIRFGQGHAPDHATFWCLDNPIVLGGDQLLPSISPNLSVYPTEPLADPVGEWLQACADLRPFATDDQLVLPGHKTPYYGLPARLDSLIENHHGALARLSEFLASERTAAECFPALFKRTIGEGEYGLALGESYAHLNHLLLTGRATRQRRDDGAWLWNAK